MQTKEFLFAAIYLLGGFDLMTLLPGMLVLGAWVLVFGISSFALFRCPRCTKNVLRGEGWFAPREEPRSALRSPPPTVENESRGGVLAVMRRAVWR